MRISNSALQEELADLKDEHDALSRRTTQKIASQQAQITTYSHHNSVLEEELEQYKRRTQEQDAALRDLQAQCDELVLGREINERQAAEEESMAGSTMG